MVSIAGVFCFVHRLTCSVSGSCGVFFLVMVPSPLPGALFQRFPRSVRELLFAYSESVDLVAWCVALSITRAVAHHCRARIRLGHCAYFAPDLYPLSALLFFTPHPPTTTDPAHLGVV